MKRRIASLILLVLTASRLHAAVLTLVEYTAALTRMRDFIDAGQIDAARAEAKAITASSVDSPNGRFQADSTLLAEVNAAKPHDLKVESRIDSTLEALRRAVPARTAAPDRLLLQRLQREQSVQELPRGGEIGGVQVRAPVPDRFRDAVGNAWRWIVAKVVKFVEWLMKFWPDSGTKKMPASPRMRWTAGALVGLILAVLCVLAFAVIRRSRRAASLPVEESTPLGSSRDDDPLSRGANEWERYAEQLAAAGRLREAIRAWYHAVLVTLYGENVLRFRKGRTNWEYVAALGPEIPWRPEIIHLTRRFEEEWYGLDRSSDDALVECRTAARRILDAVRGTRREAA